MPTRGGEMRPLYRRSASAVHVWPPAPTRPRPVSLVTLSTGAACLAAPTPRSRCHSSVARALASLEVAVGPRAPVVLQGRRLYGGAGGCGGWSAAGSARSSTSLAPPLSLRLGQLESRSGHLESRSAHLESRSAHLESRSSHLEPTCSEPGAPAAVRLRRSESTIAGFARTTSSQVVASTWSPQRAGLSGANSSEVAQEKTSPHRTKPGDPKSSDAEGNGKCAHPTRVENSTSCGQTAEQEVQRRASSCARANGHTDASHTRAETGHSARPEPPVGVGLLGGGSDLGSDPGPIRVSRVEVSSVNSTTVVSGECAIIGGIVSAAKVSAATSAPINADQCFTGNTVEDDAKSNVVTPKRNILKNNLSYRENNQQSESKSGKVEDIVVGSENRQNTLELAAIANGHQDGRKIRNRDQLKAGTVANTEAAHQSSVLSRQSDDSALPRQSDNSVLTRQSDISLLPRQSAEAAHQSSVLPRQPAEAAHQSSLLPKQSAESAHQSSVLPRQSDDTTVRSSQVLQVTKRKFSTTTMTFLESNRRAVLNVNSTNTTNGTVRRIQSEGESADGNDPKKQIDDGKVLRKVKKKDDINNNVTVKGANHAESITVLVTPVTPSATDSNGNDPPEINSRQTRKTQSQVDSPVKPAGRTPSMRKSVFRDEVTEAEVSVGRADIGRANTGTQSGSGGVGSVALTTEQSPQPGHGLSGRPPNTIGHMPAATVRLTDAPFQHLEKHTGQQENALTLFPFSRRGLRKTASGTRVTAGEQLSSGVQPSPLTDKTDGVGNKPCYRAHADSKPADSTTPDTTSDVSKTKPTAIRSNTHIADIHNVTNTNSAHVTSTSRLQVGKSSPAVPTVFVDKDAVRYPPSIPSTAHVGGHQLGTKCVVAHQEDSPNNPDSIHPARNTLPSPMLQQNVANDNSVSKCIEPSTTEHKEVISPSKEVKLSKKKIKPHGEKKQANGTNLKDASGKHKTATHLSLTSPLLRADRERNESKQQSTLTENATIEGSVAGTHANTSTAQRSRSDSATTATKSPKLAKYPRQTKQAKRQQQLSASGDQDAGDVRESGLAGKRLASPSGCSPAVSSGERSAVATDAARPRLSPRPTTAERTAASCSTASGSCLSGDSDSEASLSPLEKERRALREERERDEVRKLEKFRRRGQKAKLQMERIRLEDDPIAYMKNPANHRFAFMMKQADCMRKRHKEEQEQANKSQEIIPGAADSGVTSRPLGELDDAPFDRRRGPLGGPRPKFRQYGVDDFQFLRVLGKGAFGKVMLLRMKSTKNYFAVKCLRKDKIVDEEDLEDTLTERKILALGTNHPYLCHLFCTFQTPSHLFFVLELLNGGDLNFHLTQMGQFDAKLTRFLASEVVCGLRFLHKRGIIYRDLKLDNILLDHEGHVRIADFGMCKMQIFLDRTAEAFCGTVDYMAPEVVSGKKYNQSVDWWSFGIMLYEMLVGVTPFIGLDEAELFWAIRTEQPYYPRLLDDAAVEIVKWLLVKEPTLRLGSAECPAGGITSQPFFRSVDWIAVERKQVEPPFKPDLATMADCRYFEERYTTLSARLTNISSGRLRQIRQDRFTGFDYTNPNTTD